jgi:hypothetical protein
MFDLARWMAGEKERRWKLAHPWRAAGVALLALVLVVGIAVGAAITAAVIAEQGLGETLEGKNGSQIHYRDVSVDETRKLAQSLDGYFERAVKVQLTRRPGGGPRVVRLMTTERGWREPALVSGYDRLRQQISDEAFAGEPLELELVDGEWETQKVLRGE